jgi:hypothetical protein
MAYRFQGICIDSVTVENYEEVLSKSLVLQVVDFLPPSGSFDDECLQRYLQNLKNYEEEDANSNMTLANRLRIAFKDMQPDTICGKFPLAELPLKTAVKLAAEITGGGRNELYETALKLKKA